MNSGRQRFVKPIKYRVTHEVRQRSWFRSLKARPKGAETSSYSIFPNREQICEGNKIDSMTSLTTLNRSLPARFFVSLLFGLTGAALASAKTEDRVDDRTGYILEDAMKLPPFEVNGVRMEDLGFRFGFGLLIRVPGNIFTIKTYSIITEVIPNTPAAKAGLRPGDQIYKIDGQSKSFFLAIRKLRALQEQKWAELEGGKKSVTCSLEVGAPGAVQRRTITMVIPSPAPHWGSEKWSSPEGRLPAIVKESGPLAALAQEVLDNGIWSALSETWLFDVPPTDVSPVLGYEWRIAEPSGTHRIWITEQRGKTEILVQYLSPEMASALFLTSPMGAMDKARYSQSKKNKEKEMPVEELRTRFEKEINFWVTRVGPITGRWPFEASPMKTEAIAASSGARDESGQPGAPLAKAFLKLPVATPEDKQLFFDALGKVGLDVDVWAYTENSRSFDDRVLTIRFDPSKPPEERCTLLRVDGKVPKAALLQQWRNEGHGAHEGLGELPALASIVDTNDVRIYSNETAAVVFELPVKASNSEFPADKFQARFRVNKTSHGFEDFSVKLRESMRVVGIAKVTDAGLEARFQTFDPALVPQPVFLKMGGGVRVFFVKVSRALEVTRTDFKRVAPFQN